MQIIKCKFCGNNFRVEKIIAWKYSHVCDHCIQRANKVNENTREAREDAKIDFEESMYEFAIQQSYEVTR